MPTRVLRGVGTAFAAALLAPVDASAQNPVAQEPVPPDSVARAPVAPGSGVAPGGTEGIRNAKKAGIYVDPQVEGMMAHAPKGTCSNDPTLAKCTKVSAVMYAPEMFSLPADTPPPTFAAEPAVKSAAKGARIRARAAQIPLGYACAVKVNGGSPYWDGQGYVRMDAQNICHPGTSNHDIYLRLMKFWNNSWYNMNDRWYHPGAGQYWHGSLRYGCTAYSARLWRGEAHAFVTRNGVRWGGYAERLNSAACG